MEVAAKSRRSRGCGRAKASLVADGGGVGIAGIGLAECLACHERISLIQAGEREDGKTGSLKDEDLPAGLRAALQAGTGGRGAALWKRRGARGG